MHNLVKLFSILQLTKDQPLTGYLLSGIKIGETATLAEHHYTCTLMGYLLGQKITAAGGQLDVEKLIKMLMVHDLSELFGGDIAAPLSRKYPDLREHKDKIGERAMELLSSYLDDKTGAELRALFQEFEFGDSDEKAVGKIIDQMDHQFFFEHNFQSLRYSSELWDYRNDFVGNHIYKLTEKIKDSKTKEVMEDFLKNFDKNFFKKGYQTVNILMK